MINTIISDNDLIGTFAYLDDVLICGSSQEEHDLDLERFRKFPVGYNLTLNDSKCQHGLNEICYLGYCISGGSLRPDPECLKPFVDLPVPSASASLKP